MKKILSIIILGLLLIGIQTAYTPIAHADNDEFICYDDNNNGECDPGEDASVTGNSE